VLDPTQLSKRDFYPRLFRAPSRGYDLISLSFPSFHMMMVLLALGQARRTEVWDHNWRVLETWNPLRRSLYEIFLRRCRELILVAPHLKDYYRAHGVELPQRTQVRHGFLPPPPEEESKIVETYTSETLAFVEAHRPLIVANGFRIVAHKGVDLYGLDMCVELVGALKKTCPRIGLVFALGEFEDAKYREKIERRIGELDIAGNIHLMAGQKEIWPLFRRADLMVRPTYTDGYAVSLAEALYLNCPAVASDVSERPPDAILFHNRDQKEFESRCREALAAHTRAG
ncbi:MAG: glycosyltransferase, partial [Acidobacteria bacterium]|nr:glycosyltransferase [Acidobacteriota bacterium]